MKRARVLAVVLAAAIGISSVSVPTAGATSHNWSKSQCEAWLKGFKKRNPHPSSKRTAEGNKVLEKNGCKEHV
jgi:hypothetical protein